MYFGEFKIEIKKVTILASFRMALKMNLANKTEEISKFAKSVTTAIDK